MTRSETCTSVTREIRALLPDNIKGIKLTIRHFGDRARVIIPRHTVGGIDFPKMTVEHRDLEQLAARAAGRITAHVDTVS